MRERINDILDDEVRIIGAGPKNPPRRKVPRWFYPLLTALLLLLMTGIVIAFWPRGRAEMQIQGVYEETGIPFGIIYPSEGSKILPPLSRLASIPDPFAETIDTTINDIPLKILIPHNALPELSIGKPDPADTSIILIAQAADIRSDNLKILGSFVYKGEVVARGTSKKGYCAIIDGRITLGVDETTPLFEMSTEHENYFFRQFGLVHEGKLVENEFRNKSLRKALCSRGNEVFIACSQTAESFHDFSQALADLGCDEAISLVGGASFGWAVSPDGTRTLLGVDVHRYKNENYVLWRRVKPRFNKADFQPGGRK